MNDICKGFHIHKGTGKNKEIWRCDKCDAIITKIEMHYEEKIKMLIDMKGLNEDVFGKINA